MFKYISIQNKRFFLDEFHMEVSIILESFLIKININVVRKYDPLNELF